MSSGGPPGNPYQPPQQPAPPGATGGGDPALKWVVPVGRSWLAIAAGYAGIFSIFLVPAPLALLFSLAAMVHLKKNPDKLGWGRAIFGLVMGVLFTALLILVIVAAPRH